MALIVICMVPLGLAVNYLPWNDFQTFLFNLHKTLGIVVLVLVTARLAYRLMHTPPPLPSSVPRYQHALAGGVHVALYGLLFAMPIIGWVGTNAYGEPMRVFWSMTLPAVVDKDERLSNLLWAMHNWLGLTVGGLIAVHAAAALAHRFVQKDGVLGRMWPP